MSSADALPTEAEEALDTFDAALADMQSSLHPILTQAALLSELDERDPLAAAKLRVTLAYAINALFFMLLKTQGESPASHPVTEELARVRTYMDKIKRHVASTGAAGTVAQAEAAQRVVVRATSAKRDRHGASDSSGDGAAPMDVYATATAKTKKHKKAKHQ